MMIFKHTSRERGMWRGWLENGQSVEFYWGRHGWDFGLGVHIHSNDEDEGNRMLFLKLWRWTAIIPLGIIHRPHDIETEPQWSVYASKEFGFTIHWNRRRYQWDWPWNWHTLAYEKQLIKGDDGSWVDVMDYDATPYTEGHPYTYTLNSGEVQHRVANVSRRRHIITWRAFKWSGWPRWVKDSINIEFSDEVGERSGSWKGGCIGCSYDIRPGETMEQALRRMEAERKF